MNLDLTSFEGAVAQLKGAMDMYDSELVQSNPDIKKYLRGSVIHTFEITYEIAFKMIKRYLKMSSASPEEIDAMTFNNIIREAYGKNIVRFDLSAWIKYRENRATAGYTYNEDKAQAVFEDAPNFLDESRYVLSRLQEMTKSFD